MARITVSVEPAISLAAKARAEAQRRSVSGYVQLLIEADLTAAGVLTPAHRMVVGAKLGEAIAEASRLGIDVEALIRRAIAEGRDIPAQVSP